MAARVADPVSPLVPVGFASTDPIKCCSCWGSQQSRGIPTLHSSVRLLQSFMQQSQQDSPGRTVSWVCLLGSPHEERGGAKKVGQKEKSHPHKATLPGFSGWQVHYHRLMRSLVLPVAAIMEAVLPLVPPPSIKSDRSPHSNTHTEKNRHYIYKSGMETPSSFEGRSRSLQLVGYTDGPTLWPHFGAGDYTVIRSHLWTQWEIISTSGTALRCDHLTVPQSTTSAEKTAPEVWKSLPQRPTKEIFERSLLDRQHPTLLLGYYIAPNMSLLLLGA